MNNLQARDQTPLPKPLEDNRLSETAPSQNLTPGEVRAIVLMITVALFTIAIVSTFGQLWLHLVLRP